MLAFLYFLSKHYFIHRITPVASYSGYYTVNCEIIQPQKYYNDCILEHWTPNGLDDFITVTCAVDSLSTSHDEIRKELSKYKPVVIGAGYDYQDDGVTKYADHLALVVSYIIDDQTKECNFIVLDSCKTDLSDLNSFCYSFDLSIQTWTYYCTLNKQLYGIYE